MRTLQKLWWQLACTLFGLVTLCAGPSLALVDSTDFSAIPDVAGVSEMQLQSPWLQDGASSFTPRPATSLVSVPRRLQTGESSLFAAQSPLSVRNAAFSRARGWSDKAEAPMTDVERWTLGAMGSAVSLGTRTLSLIPLGIGAATTLAMISGPAFLLAGALSALTFTFVDSAISAFALQLAYNSRNAVRPQSDFLPLFAAHLMGNLLAAGVTGIGYGGVALVLFTSESLSAFVAGSAISLLVGTTGLALLPVTILSFAVSMIAPAYFVVDALSKAQARALTQRELRLLPARTVADQGVPPKGQHPAWLLSVSLPELG